MTAGAMFQGLISVEPLYKSYQIASNTRNNCKKLIFTKNSPNYIISYIFAQTNEILDYMKDSTF